MKRIMLVLTVALVMVGMLLATAGLALALPGNGKGDSVGGGDTSNSKDVKAEKTRTGGGPANNPHVDNCGAGCTPA